MRNLPLVRISSILPFVDFLDRLGAPTQKLLRTTHLPISALDQPEALIPLRLGCEFLEAAAHSQGIENLGMIVGELTPIDSLGAWGRLLCQSNTLYELLITIKQSICSYNSGERFWLRGDGNWVWLHSLTSISNNAFYTQKNHYSFLLYLNAIRLAAPPGWRSPEIHLTSSKVNYLKDCDLFADTRLYFDQSVDAICFRRSLLSLPLRNPLKRSASQNQKDYQSLQETTPANDFSGSLRQSLRPLLRESYPDIELAAEIAGMSVRTLQRCLAEESLSYSRLIEQVRFDTAVTLLRASSTKLVDIALELGYRDPANFSRAFKRWTGVSPQAFREQQQGCSSDYEYTRYRTRGEKLNPLLDWVER